MKSTHLLLTLSCFVLAACGSSTPSSSIVDSSKIESSSAQITTEQESILSPSESESFPEESGEDPTDVSSSEEESDLSESAETTTEEIASEESSSEAEPVLSESTEVTSEEITSQDASEEVGDWSIDASIAKQSNQNYPLPYDEAVETSGITFNMHFVDVMQGKGKDSGNDPYIQMKKESGEMYADQPMKGQLTVSMFYNYVSYTGYEADLTGYPLVSASSTIGDEQAEPIQYECQINDRVATFTVEIDGYLRIAGGDYASYFYSISFVKATN